MAKNMFLALLGLLLLGCVVADSDYCVNTTIGFEKFAKDFQKKYADQHDRTQHYNNFCNFCRELQKDLLDKNIKHQMGINENADIDVNTITKPLQFPQNVPTKEPPRVNAFTALTSAVGVSLGVTATNWRTKNMVTTPKNQGSCGSCWAHATAACYESGLLRALSITADLSQEWILECTDAFNTTRNPKSSCQGGVVDFALPMLVATGAPREATYPYVAGAYTGATHPGSIANCFAPVTYEVLKYGNGSLAQWYRYNNVTAAQIQSLLATGTLVIAFYVENTFYSYKSGVYSCPVNFATAYPLINHAMELVGMDANGDYVVKNSWGTTWGDGGFVTISATSDCGLTAYVYQLLWGQYHALSMLLLSLIVFLIA